MSSAILLTGGDRIRQRHGAFEKARAALALLARVKRERTARRAVLHPND